MASSRIYQRPALFNDTKSGIPHIPWNVYLFVCLAQGAFHSSPAATTKKVASWGTEVEALLDTMNGNPEGGRKKIQRKAGRLWRWNRGCLMVTLEAGWWFDGKPWDFLSQIWCWMILMVLLMGF